LPDETRLFLQQSFLCSLRLLELVAVSPQFAPWSATQATLKRSRRQGDTERSWLLAGYATHLQSGYNELQRLKVTSMPAQLYKRRIFSKSSSKKAKPWL
jgi:hypothetical protein